MCLLLAGGCTHVADVTGTATQQDLMQIRGDIATLQQGVARARNEADTAAVARTESHAREQAAASERQSAALTRRLDGLATSVSELSARVDDLNGRVEALNRQLRAAAPAPPPPRPSAPTAGAPPPPPPPPTTTAQPTPPVPVRPSTNALQPQDIYQAAYIDFSKGSYALAMAGFREFIRRFPDHDLADNAQYWIGEAHFSVARGYANAGQTEKATQELELAVQEFKKVLANYPRGDKAPTALYKEALALLELRQPAVALQRLEYLVANFPQSEETPLARERLAQLKPR